VPWDTSQCQSRPVLGDGVWRCEACGDARALLCREVGSGAMGHMVTPEPSGTGRWGLAPRDT
jgi:hypothetical protein